MADWYYETGGKAVGPFGDAILRDWIRGGSIRRDQLVRDGGSSEWRRADLCFPDLFPSSKAPDFLGELTTAYFECDGLCFVPVLDAIDGMCRVNLFYQNRFSGKCKADITLRSVRDFLGRSASNGPLAMQVDCEGGEFGVVRQFLGIKTGKQGKRVGFVVEGTTNYPDGKGEMVRIETGLSAQRQATSDTLLHVIIGVVSLGHLIIRHNPATIHFQLPRGVAEIVHAGLAREVGVLWSMG